MGATPSGPRTKVSKNQVVWARCHFVGLVTGIDCSCWSSSDSRAANDSVRSRAARYTEIRSLIISARAPPTEQEHWRPRSMLVRQARVDLARDLEATGAPAEKAHEPSG